MNIETDVDTFSLMIVQLDVLIHLPCIIFGYVCPLHILYAIQFKYYIKYCPAICIPILYNQSIVYLRY